MRYMAVADQQPLPFSNDQRRRHVPTNATLTVPEAADLLGIGRNLAYEIAKREGELAGVPVIKVGRRLLVPHARLLVVLGLLDDPPER